MHGARGLATFSRTPSGLACGAARLAIARRAGVRWFALDPDCPILFLCAFSLCQQLLALSSLSACGHMWRTRRARGFHPRRHATPPPSQGPPQGRPLGRRLRPSRWRGWPRYIRTTDIDMIPLGGETDGPPSPALVWRCGFLTAAPFVLPPAISALLVAS